MTGYLARVEIHGASGDDYKSLHDLMFRVGFAMVIQALNGKFYGLPHATYYASFPWEDVARAAQIARDAANLLGKPNDLIVGLSNQQSFFLDEVKV